MGLDGYFKFLSKKLLIVYNDDSFSWKQEGTFLKKTYTPPVKISKVLRNLYSGKYYKKYSSCLQFIWINILLCIFISAIVSTFKKSKIDYIYKEKILKTDLSIFLLKIKFGIDIYVCLNYNEYISVLTWKK